MICIPFITAFGVAFVEVMIGALIPCYSNPILARANIDLTSIIITDAVPWIAGPAFLHPMGEACRALRGLAVGARADVLIAYHEGAIMGEALSA